MTALAIFALVVVYYAGVRMLMHASTLRDEEQRLDRNAFRVCGSTLLVILVIGTLSLLKSHDLISIAIP